MSAIYRVFASHLPSLVPGWNLSWCVTSKCFLHVSPCLVCHLSLCLTAHYWDIVLASLPPSYLSARRWRVEVMENSGALLMIDSFHLSCQSTWLTSPPHSSAHSSLFNSSHLFQGLTECPPPVPPLSPPHSYPFLPNTCMDKLLAASANPPP